MLFFKWSSYIDVLDIRFIDASAILNVAPSNQYWEINKLF